MTRERMRASGRRVIESSQRFKTIWILGQFFEVS